jgi:hypothetical protein
MAASACVSRGRRTPAVSLKKPETQEEDFGNTTLGSPLRYDLFSS